ncbi:ABC transporter permease [Roseivirga sp. 4D4]|uniref:ABC transporter permease n=1 Tax=Roseivirga sp. 4D4 TaxID=1889784 RepID=UPI00147BD95B|nr:ABC transporter permease [Roseivirga sp. 4D4]
MSSLNVLGLSIGIGCFLVISLYLFQENSYEKGFSNSERIYRIEEDFMGIGVVALTSNNLPYRLGDISVVESHTRVGALGGQMKVIVDNNRYSQRVLSADSSFFKIFDYEFVQGDPGQVLKNPRETVLSRETALELFGTTDVLGQQLEFLDFPPHTIVGVTKPSVIKSHIDFDVLLTHRNDEYKPTGWYGIGGYSYVKLVPGATQNAFQARLDSLTKDNIYPVVHPSGSLPFAEWVSSPNKIKLFPKPVRSIHSSSNVQMELGPNGDYQTRVTLTIIGLFILVIASINFMNLTTAKSSHRTKEIGMRKVLGASKKRLTTYFLVESVFITFISTVIGAALSELFIRVINIYWNGDITVSLLTYPILLAYLLAFVLVLGFVSGIYPAFFLSSAKMIPLLKGMKLGRVLNLASAKTMRNGLVILQFAISTTLIIASLFINNQLKHLSAMDLGFNNEQVLVIKNMPVLKSSKKAFRSELIRNPAVKKVGFSHRLPADGSSATTSVLLDSETSFTADHFYVDENFDEVLDLNVLEGEWFNSEKQQYDSLVVLNKTAAMSLGYDDPVGKVFGKYWTIIGVVEDFYYGGLRQEIGPAMFIYDKGRFNLLSAQIDAKLISIDEIEEIWSGFTNEPLEYYYLDQNFERQIQSEKENANAVLVFTVLAIFISCLGLFGLAAFKAEERLHEFGVRKVLGAKVSDIIKHFGGGFLRLIVFSFIVAIPIAYYGVNLWLEGYANRISIGLLPFMIAGCLALLIGLGTIFYQSIKTAKLNPVDTLRSE